MSRTLSDIFMANRREYGPDDFFGPAATWPTGQTAAMVGRDGTEVYVVKGGRLRKKRWVKR